MSRIAYLCADPGIGVFGTKGASVHVQEVVRALRADGHEVRVYCTRRGDHVPADLVDLSVTVEPVPRAGSADREQAVRAAAQRLATVALEDDCDLVYERYSLFSRAGATVAATNGAPLIVEVNSPLIDEQRDHRVLYDESAARTDTTITLAVADVIACVSTPVARWVQTVAPDVAERVIVAPNGVNTDRIRPAEAPRDSPPPTVGFVGTLKPWHGTDVLMHAASLSRLDWNVAICGDGPERAALERLALDLGIADRTTFTGALPPAEVPDFLTGIDIAVAPYPAAAAADHYFSPLKVYEYFAAGLPVVASNIGQIPDIVQDGHTGLLVRPSDADGLAAALDRLAADAEQRHRLGSAARHRAVTHHDWSQVVRRILDALTPIGVTR